MIFVKAPLTFGVAAPSGENVPLAIKGNYGPWKLSGKLMARFAWKFALDIHGPLRINSDVSVPLVLLASQSCHLFSTNTKLYWVGDLLGTFTLPKG